MCMSIACTCPRLPPRRVEARARERCDGDTHTAARALFAHALRRRVAERGHRHAVGRALVAVDLAAGSAVVAAAQERVERQAALGVAAPGRLAVGSPLGPQALLLRRRARRRHRNRRAELRWHDERDHRRASPQERGGRGGGGGARGGGDARVCLEAREQPRVECHRLEELVRVDDAVAVRVAVREDVGCLCASMCDVRRR